MLVAGLRAQSAAPCEMRAVLPPVSALANGPGPGGTFQQQMDPE